MVRVINSIVEKEEDEEFKLNMSEFLKLKPVQPQYFQQVSSFAIYENKNVIVSAPTGSGKSFVAEYAIFNEVINRKKKVIYCSPIKALSNQKFRQMTEMYSSIGITIGIITGDISVNTNADVLIMTTEILLQKISNPNQQTIINNFELSVEDLGYVVFDEIHMIGDASRGHVIEKCITLLPETVRIIGLSGTLSNPLEIATWMEKVRNVETYLTIHTIRPVPLTTYVFNATHSGVNKRIKDKTLQAYITQNTNILQVMSNESIQTSMNIMDHFKKNNISIHRSHLLNTLCNVLVEKEMMPALCYVYSRKMIEVYANEITTNILEFDSKVPYTIAYECEHLLRSKLPNYSEYIAMPEYVQLVKWLEKGIAIHHSGMMPILREIVEILFAKGKIKLLFCTESVAVGMNLPVKTTIFTDINKHDGSHFRMLYGYEYIQSAGRAGRLGLDTVGNVIHLFQHYSQFDISLFKSMLQGVPPTIQSQMYVSYSNILINKSDMLSTTDDKLIQDSLWNEQHQMQINQQQTNIVSLEMSVKKGLHEMFSVIPYEKAYEYCITNTKLIVSLKNKSRREMEKKQNQMEEEYPTINTKETEINVYKMSRMQSELESKKRELESTMNAINMHVDAIRHQLKRYNFITEDNMLTMKGQMGAVIKEMPCIYVIHHIEELYNFNSLEMIEWFSCYTSISKSDLYEEMNANVSKTNKIYKWYKQTEDEWKSMKEYDILNGIRETREVEIHYALIEFMKEWTESETEEDCKRVLQAMKEKGISVGEFVKAILKINNMAREMEMCAEMSGQLEWKNTLKNIQRMTMKYVATNQSLYV
jgi:superfamily II RNA helicase